MIYLVATFKYVHELTKSGNTIEEALKEILELGRGYGRMVISEYTFEDSDPMEHIGVITEIEFTSPLTIKLDD